MHHTIHGGVEKQYRSTPWAPYPTFPPASLWYPQAYIKNPKMSPHKLPGPIFIPKVVSYLQLILLYRSLSSYSWWYSYDIPKFHGVSPWYQFDSIKKISGDESLPPISCSTCGSPRKNNPLLAVVIFPFNYSKNMQTTNGLNLMKTTYPVGWWSFSIQLPSGKLT